jgi:glycosyltransferase involved in cell wall biosynthesis
VSRRGLSGAVELAPFLAEPDFRSTLAGAAMVLFPSDFEGFGLPVAEGMRLGIPVVIGPERATLEVAGGHAVVMSEWTSTALAAAVEAAINRSELELADARRFAARYTWAATAAHTRHLLESLSHEANAAREP